jgi:membrane protein
LAIPARGWLDIGWRIWTRMGTKRLSLIAAGIAFYGLLSLFPAITAAVAIIGLVYDPELLLNKASWLLTAMPNAAGEMISRQIGQVASAGTDSLGLAAIISLGIALWSASRAMASFIQGLNLIYDEEEKRGFLLLNALIIGFTLVFIFGMAAAVVIVAAIPAAVDLLAARDRWGEWALLLRWPLMLCVGIVGMAALYRYGPSRREATWRWLSPGAALACALWLAGSYGFSFYVQSFGNYNETFGALAGVVILLTWLWLSAFVVLLGALFDAETEAQTRCDSTVGPDRPMGERGAVKADFLGTAYTERESTGD